MDARVLDLKPEQDSPFLRTQKRVPVRRGPLPKKTALKLKYLLLAVVVMAALAVVASIAYRYGRSSWRFRLESSDDIQVVGTRNVTRAQVMDLFGQDISRNIFAIPLDERKKQAKRISWVESATVMRLLPNRLRINIKERTPIAFAQVETRIMLVDGSGVLMDLPSAPKQYSFPVIVGLGEKQALSQRAASMRLYQKLIRELDASGANYSRGLDEVDLADPEDVKIIVTDSHGTVLVHLGASSFLDRYKIFEAHIEEWRQQFQRVDSVDLRYDGQVIVNPDAPRAAVPAASATASAANTPPAKPAGNKASGKAAPPHAAVSKRHGAKNSPAGHKSKA